MDSVMSFIDKKGRTARDKRTVRNLLADQAKERFIYHKSLKKLHDHPITSKKVIDNIPVAIKDTVTSYTKDKTTAIKVFKEYLAFLDMEYGVKVEVNFPPTFNSQFDRQMYIVKRLHDRKYRASDFENELWVSDRTISADLQALEDGISVLGQQLKIKRDDVVYHNQGLNTVHPIFLTANLTQVVVLLKGLEVQALDPAYSEYAIRLAANIWSELSDYGRNRILKVSEQLNLNKAWFEMLESQRNHGLYSTEADCSYEHGVGNVLNFLKNSQPCTIEVQEKHGTRILKDCLIRSHSSSHIKVIHEDKEEVIPIDAVIRASKYGKCLY